MPKSYKYYKHSTTLIQIKSLWKYNIKQYIHSTNKRDLQISKTNVPIYKSK